MEGIAPDYRAWAEIDLGALMHNFNIARKTGKKVMCVIKADAYGHGAVACGLYLQEHGADAFAVACVSEAVELREHGICLPILVLGYTEAGYAELVSRYKLTQTLVDEEHARAMSAAAVREKIQVSCHVKLDTGMSRAGILAQGHIQCELAAGAVERIWALPGLKISGVYSHFSSADMPEERAYTAWQLDNFTRVLGLLADKGIRPETCHIGNSAAIMNLPEARFDMVREGIMLYGLYPDNQPRLKGELMPVMSLKSRVSQVRDMPEGTSVSYGRAYRSAGNMKMAVISAGYADGYSRRLGNQAYVVIGGRRYPQIGRVCMDMIMADVTGGDVHRGETAVLLGGEGMSLEEAAGLTGTINYELACLVTPRAQRIYVGTEDSVKAD